MSNYFEDQYESAAKTKNCIHDVQYQCVDTTDIVLVMLDSQALSPDLITCITDKDVDELKRLDDMVHFYGQTVENSTVYKPLFNEICVVKIGQIWYRCAFQTEISNDKGKVYAMDYGSAFEVDMQNIRVCVLQLQYNKFKR